METAEYVSDTPDGCETVDEIIEKSSYEAMRTDGMKFCVEPIKYKEKDGKYIHTVEIGHGYLLYHNDYYYKDYCDIKKAKFPTFSGSRIEKVQQIYEYILTHISYDTSNYTSYKTLTDGKGLCEGQAALFYRLCRLNHIPCHMVYGKVYDEKHAWNAVKIDGNWYYVDATNGLYKDCFLRGKKSFDKYWSEKQFKIAENDYLGASRRSKEHMFFEKKLNDLLNRG